jgi:hypothetical protein
MQITRDFKTCKIDSETVLLLLNRLGDTIYKKLVLIANSYPNGINSTYSVILPPPSFGHFMKFIGDTQMFPDSLTITEGADPLPNLVLRYCLVGDGIVFVSFRHDGISLRLDYDHNYVNVGFFAADNVAKNIVRGGFKTVSDLIKPPRGRTYSLCPV